MSTRQSGIESIGSPLATATRTERRRGSRQALPLRILVRPSANLPNDFDEVCTTVNIMRDGFYFFSSLASYRRGMQLIVTWLNSASPDNSSIDFIGKIVRIDSCSRNRWGVAVQLVQPICS
jgi:hypothetical protein